MLELETHLGAVFCSITEAAMTGGAAHALRRAAARLQRLYELISSVAPPLSNGAYFLLPGACGTWEY